MARLPQPGSDEGTWGQILNEYLLQSHKNDGSLKSGSVSAGSIPDGTISEDKLDSATQAKINSTGGVTSVNTRTGAVTLAKSDVGLANVDNTADTAKPVSTATQTALDGKADTSHNHTASDVSDFTEVSQDIIGSTIVAGSNINVTYNDSLGEVTIAATATGGTNATNLSASTTSNSVSVLSDTGTDATIPAANGTDAGVLTASDKSKLDGIAANATANSSDATLLNRANHTGTQTASTVSDFAETVRDTMGTALVAGTNVTITPNDGADTITIAASGGTGSTNLSVSQSSSQVVVNSDTGTDATIPAVDDTNAGVMTPTELSRIDALETAVADIPAAGSLPISSFPGQLDDSQLLPGMVLFQAYTAGNAASVSRPTSRTDIQVRWRGPASDPPAALEPSVDVIDDTGA